MIFFIEKTKSKKDLQILPDNLSHKNFDHEVEIYLKVSTLN
jgi:hypothetical protein